MAISLTCPECSSSLRIADNLAGKQIKCPKCSAIFAVPAPEEAITAEIPPEAEDLADDEMPRPRRMTRNIRRDPADEAVSTIIPYKNAKALIAYYLGVFSFIPCLGHVLGPAALILGILGLRYAKTYPTAKGTGHAIAGIIMGSLTTLAYWGLTLAVMVMGGISAVMK